MSDQAVIAERPSRTGAECIRRDTSSRRARTDLSGSRLERVVRGRPPQTDQSDGMWRSFDVGAVVDSLPSGDAVVAAGAGGMARRVSRARLAASPEHLREVEANELVVTTTATLLAAGGTVAELVHRLQRAQAGGLAVRLDPSVSLPSELLSAADALSFPLIVFPEGTALADVTAAVLDALLTAQGQRLERILDIHQRFTRIVLAGGGATEIAATLHDLLGCPVAVADADGNASVVAPADSAGAFDQASAPAIRQPIQAGEHNYGEIIALADEASLDEDQRLALERASMAIALRLAQASAVAEAEERFAAISLEELIAGHPGDAAAVAERAISFGWDLARPRAVLLASIDPPADGPNLAVALGNIAAAARATLGHDAIVWTRSATIAALVAPQSDAPAERRRIAEGLRLELDRRLSSVNVSIGVGRRVDTPSELPRSFYEASRAVDVGRWAKGRHVTEVFDELGLERLLASTPTDDLAEFVQHSIGTLVDYDRVNRTDLVETLDIWLQTRNMAEAARRVHVHYNTLKNRLERVEAILGPIVDDSARSLECQVAIFVARHYEGASALDHRM